MEVVSSLQRTPPRLSVREFRAFYDQRPDHERWELIDGVPIQMMTPPTLVHQRIAGNLEHLLRQALETHHPELMVFQRVGVNIGPHVDDYDPEPDVVVVDGPIRSLDDRYSDRFYLAGEVVSRSDRVSINRKREVYKLNAACRCILTVQQERPEIRVDRRTERRWGYLVLKRMDDLLELPDFGLRCTLADIYKGVPLKPPMP
jgi:Uma2 family endonuclease